MSDKHYELAKVGENLSACFLEKAGYKILARNYHSAHGEIDIIALDGTEISFAEVKTRTGISLKAAENSINKSKQKKLTLTAYSYLSENPQLSNCRCRFDAVIVLYNIHDDTYSIKHEKNAFLPQSDDTD
jgi:putative endonuclease